MKVPEASVVTCGLDEGLSAAGVTRFSHQAMATVFEVFCAGSDPVYARQAAQAAFDLVDTLETEMSRFVDNSDISRINSLTAGQSTRVSPSTMDCLQMAELAHIETDGAFDISIGSGLANLKLDPDNFSVHLLADGVRLDLGGIGKGYAVDCMAELLWEWGIEQALIHGGLSSVRALEPPADSSGWPVTLSMPGGGSAPILTRLSVRRQALSGSGIQKGEHIHDSRADSPLCGRLAAWVSVSARNRASSGPTVSGNEPNELPATIADALSTAFMILSDEQIGARCRRQPGVEVWLIPEPDGAALPELLHIS